MKFDWGWKSSHISNTLSFRINITQLLINIKILSKYWFDFPFWPLLIFFLIQQLFSLIICYTNDFSLQIKHFFFIWTTYHFTYFLSEYSINFHLLLLFLILFFFLCDFYFILYLFTFFMYERQYNKTYDLMFIHLSTNTKIFFQHWTIFFHFSQKSLHKICLIPI